MVEAPTPGGGACPGAPGSIEQDTCTFDVGMDEAARIGYGAIYMTFSRKVYNGVTLLVIEEVLHGLVIGYVSVNKSEVVSPLDTGQVSPVSSIGECIYRNKTDRWVRLHHVKEIIGANEAGAAGDQHGAWLECSHI